MGGLAQGVGAGCCAELDDDVLYATETEDGAGFEGVAWRVRG